MTSCQHTVNNHLKKIIYRIGVQKSFFFFSRTLNMTFKQRNNKHKDIFPCSQQATQGEFVFMKTAAAMTELPQQEGVFKFLHKVC